MEKLLNQYKNIKHSLSFEEEKEMLYQYVYFTNKLEGNNLSYAQTTELLSSDTISGNNIKTHDILEQKGMYKAVVRMLNAASNKEALSLNLIKELNAYILSSLWKDDANFIQSKQHGQTLNSFKLTQNVIRINKGGKLLKKIEPLSSPENVDENMTKLISSVNASEKSTLEKAMYLAQEIWLHQPFVDGNKRTGRLLINFLLIKEGYPLFFYEDKSTNYNNLLVQEYIENKKKLVLAYVKERLVFTMKKAIKSDNDIEPSKDLGFRLLLFININ